MARPLPASLRGQVLLAVLLALTVAQGIGAAIAVLTRQQAVRAAQVGDAFDRAAALAYVIERTPADLHNNILRAAETPLTRLSVDPAASVPAGDPALGRLRSRLVEALDGAGRGEVRMAMITAAGNAVRLPVPGQEDAEVGHEDDEGEEEGEDDSEDERKAGSHLSSPGETPPAVRGDDRRSGNDAAAAGRDDHSGPDDRGPPGRRKRPPPELIDTEALAVSIALESGGWLNADIRFPRPDRGLPVLSLVSFALAALAIGIALWLALARLLGPIRHLATAAEGLGRGEALAPLPAKGPSEMRALTEAFNHMQQRLHRMVSDRTQMLAALGHDLRSPLTALRVQAEMVDDDETREHLMASLAEMQEMVEQTLTYARGVWTAEAMEDVDLGALLDDLGEESGVAVRRPAGAVMLRLRPATIRRALRNLIDNARRYGTPPFDIVLIPGPDAVTVEISDRGPGIPAEALARVFDPFVRLEASRSRETGGTGLGLSIARSIVQAHGGEVSLANREGGGLIARVTLPRPPQGQGQG